MDGKVALSPLLSTENGAMRLIDLAHRRKPLAWLLNQASDSLCASYHPWAAGWERIILPFGIGSTSSPTCQLDRWDRN